MIFSLRSWCLSRLSRNCWNIELSSRLMGGYLFGSGFLTQIVLRARKFKDTKFLRIKGDADSNRSLHFSKIRSCLIQAFPWLKITSRKLFLPIRPIFRIYFEVYKPLRPEYPHSSFDIQLHISPVKSLTVSSASIT